MSVPLSEFQWIELAAMTEQNGMCRKRFVVHDDRASIAQWAAQCDGVDWYTSISIYREPHLQAAAVTPFFLDIDARNDLERGREQVLWIAELLNQRLGIEPTSLDLAFSGGGFHVVVPLAVWGNPTDPDLICVWGSLARVLAKQGADLIDLGVYQKQRLWRAMNSYNSKHERYKVPIEFAELQDLGLDHVLELAQGPRDFQSGADPRESPKAMGWLREKGLAWARKQAAQRRQSRRVADNARGWRLPPCVRHIEHEAVLEDGTRHASYFHIARLYAKCGAHPLEITERLRSIDQRHPIRDPDYIERVAQDALKYASYFKECPHSVLAHHCDPQQCPFHPSARAQI